MTVSADRGGRPGRSLWLACWLFLPATLPLSAKAADEVVGDRTLHIEPSEGFCALDPEQDSLLFEQARSRQKGMFQIVGYWLDCRQLEKLRNGEPRAMQSYVLILAQRKGPDGSVIEPFDRPLEEYLRLLKDFLLNQGGMGRVEEGYELGKDVLKERGINPGESKSLGLIADDASALYIANIQAYESGGVSAVGAAVGGLTELNGLVVSVNVYDTYRDGGTIEVLQRRASTIAAALVAKNPTR